MRYMVGAEAVGWQESGATVAGGPVVGSATRVPKGIAHAVDLKTGHVVCGRKGAGLHEFPSLDFDNANSVDHCTACERVLSGGSA